MERPTLVFVPGFMQRGDAWGPVAERLLERYPSVLVDHATWTREERIEEIYAAAPPGAVPVGYSMGGRLVLHAALQDPGRWPALCLVGVSAGIGNSEERRLQDEELAAWIEKHEIEDVVERWERLSAFETQTEEQRAAQRPGRLAHEPSEVARLLRSAGQGAMPPVWGSLARLKLPVLCVAGERDTAYVEAGLRMVAMLPRGNLRIVPESGHAAQLENPDAVAWELRSFLDERL